MAWEKVVAGENGGLILCFALRSFYLGFIFRSRDDALHMYNYMDDKIRVSAIGMLCPYLEFTDHTFLRNKQNKTKPAVFRSFRSDVFYASFIYSVYER